MGPGKSYEFTCFLAFVFQTFNCRFEVPCFHHVYRWSNLFCPGLRFESPRERVSHSQTSATWCLSFSFHMSQDCTYVFTVRGTFLYTYVHFFFTSSWTSGPTWSQWCSLFIIRGEDSSLPLQELLDSRFKLLLALPNILIVICLLRGSSRVISPFGESTYIRESTEEMLSLVGWSDTTLSFPNILGTIRLFAGYFVVRISEIPEALRYFQHSQGLRGEYRKVWPSIKLHLHPICESPRNG